MVTVNVYLLETKQLVETGDVFPNILLSFCCLYLFQLFLHGFFCFISVWVVSIMTYSE